MQYNTHIIWKPSESTQEVNEHDSVSLHNMQTTGFSYFTHIGFVNVINLFKKLSSVLCGNVFSHAKSTDNP